MTGNSWLTDALAEPKPETLLYLRRSEVVDCLNSCDPVGIVRSALLAHGSGRTVLPSEAYLSWSNAQGAYSRSIGMPGAVLGDDPVYGMKVINASVSNPEVGMERAGGLGLCFDPQTARVSAVMEVGVLSAVRTAAVSTLAVEAVGYGSPAAIGVVGCGTQARLHLAMLLSRGDSVRQVRLFDNRRDSAENLAAALASRHPAITVTVGGSVADTMAEADVVLFLTTASEGYVRADWVAAGSLLVNVSLGDLTDEVLLGCHSLYIDDLKLITENPRRPLGRLINDGQLAGTPTPGAPSVTSTLADLLSSGTTPPRPESGYVIVNPFGLGVLDVALFAAVRTRALEAGIGQHLPLF